MTEPTAFPVTPSAFPSLSDQIKDLRRRHWSAYWRCLKCGVVWNPERPPDRSRERRPERTMQRNNVSDYWHNK